MHKRMDRRVVAAPATIEHNRLYANANYGAWFAYATPRVKPADGCWDIRIRSTIRPASKRRRPSA